MDTCACALELLGMLVFVGAWLCALATTLLPRWLTMSTALLPVESYELGLWETCVVQDVGGMECRAYDSLLGLSTDLKLARILMCASLAVGMLGMLVATPGLYLVNSCRERGGCRTKRTLTVTGGVLGMLSGVLCLIPVSYMAHLAVIHFFDDKVPEVVPRWEFGDGLLFRRLRREVRRATECICVRSCVCVCPPRQQYSKAAPPTLPVLTCLLSSASYPGHMSRASSQVDLLSCLLPQGR
uniref:Claudin n=1 Tax=Mola mola TaxID=94237 RepID=A0A3Q4AST7_MOLML